jgi:LysR family transcriptional activator of nhaA
MISLKQLHHFWLVAHRGGIQRASEASGLAPQTISAQIAALESHFGKPLFTRQGRRLILTPAGEIALHYADEIFRLTDELEQRLAGDELTLPVRVGLLDSVPKAIAALLLEPLRKLPEPVTLHVSEERFAQLVGALATGTLDLILSDMPPTLDAALPLFSHCLLDVPLAWFGAPRWGPGPITWKDLARVPLLLPITPTHARVTLLAQAQEHHVTPTIAGEFADTALLVEIARMGDGIFTAPKILEAQLCHDGRLLFLGDIPELHERYWLISHRRKRHHPAVAAMSRAFSPSSPTLGAAR